MSSVTHTPAFIAGAYAAMPTAAGDQDRFYRLLGEQTWIDGLEIPFPGDLERRPTWLAGQLAPTWRANTITAIPGTMERLQTNPQFGLASPDPAGRAEAVRFTERIREAVCRLADTTGRSAIARVQLQSAPTRIADRGCLLESLADLRERDWSGATLVIEHCDRYIPGQVPQKGFLALAEELAVGEEAGLGVHINWGRVCLEARDPDAPAAAIATARTRGLLKGVVFSGVSAFRSPYGAAWADAHLPTTMDEPTSLMGARVIADCAAKALSDSQPGEPAAYLGAKICVPPLSSLEERVAMIRRVFDSLGEPASRAGVRAASPGSAPRPGWH